MERARFVRELASGEWTMSELCEHHGVSRPTGYKLGPTVRSRRRRRVGGAQPRSTWLSAPEGGRSRRSGRALEEDSRLGSTEAPPAPSKAAIGRRPSVPQHRLRHLETPRAGEESASPSEVAAPGRGTVAHRGTKRGVDDRRQGPVQDARRCLLLSADLVGPLQPVLARMSRPVRREDGGREGHPRAGVPGARFAASDPQRQRVAIRVDRHPRAVRVERVVDEAGDRSPEDHAQQPTGERRA
jgi:hypothetical protein